MHDLLTLVDEDDNIIGYEKKEICHMGQGLLHRAFSVLLFNDNKELLLQKRSSEKLLWPQYWSNSVCSHPKKYESCVDGAKRRIKEELGITSTLIFLYKFRYHAIYYEIGSENEVCSVFIGKTRDIPIVDESEVADWIFVNAIDINLDLIINPDKYTPWFRIEWGRILKDQHLAKIL